MDKHMVICTYIWVYYNQTGDMNLHVTLNYVFTAFKRTSPGCILRLMPGEPPRPSHLPTSTCQTEISPSRCHPSLSRRSPSTESSRGRCFFFFFTCRAESHLTLCKLKKERLENSTGGFQGDSGAPLRVKCRNDRPA